MTASIQARYDMREALRDFHSARTKGRPNDKFTPRQSAVACPSRSDSEYSTLLFQHRVGNAPRRPAFFMKYSDGLYFLRDDAHD